MQTQKDRTNSIPAVSPGHYLKICSTKKDKFSHLPKRTPSLSACHRYSGLRIGNRGFTPVFPPSQVSPVTGSRHRKTDSCAYSTGCQLRTFTGFPYPHACAKAQTEAWRNNKPFNYFYNSKFPRTWIYAIYIYIYRRNYIICTKAQTQTA